MKTISVDRVGKKFVATVWEHQKDKTPIALFVTQPRETKELAMDDAREFMCPPHETESF